MKKENGITLVALIITIIILVILAAVSIRAAYQSGIIDYAVNGTANYVQGASEENTAIANAESLMQSVMNRLEGLETEILEEEIPFELRRYLLGADENGILLFSIAEPDWGNFTIVFDNAEVVVEDFIISDATEKAYILITYEDEEYILIAEGTLANLEDVMTSSVIKRDVPEETIIGKYVAYTPASGTYSKITNNATYSGTDTNTTNFTTDTNLKWRIWSLDNNTLTLIADDVASTGGDGDGILALSGALGYNNGVQILNDICKTCYSNSTWATGRSLNIEDIENVLNKNLWNPQDFHLQVGGEFEGYTYISSRRYPTQYQPGIPYYPSIHALEEYSNIDGTIKRKGQGASRSTQPITGSENGTGYYTNDSTQATSYIEPTLTFWAGADTRIHFIEDEYYNLLYKESGNSDMDDYWLASRFVNTSSIAEFGLQCISNGAVHTDWLYQSEPRSCVRDDCCVRPVVEIDLTEKTLNTEGKTGTISEMYTLDDI